MRKLLLFIVALLWGLPAWGQALSPGTAGVACLASASTPSLLENRYAPLSCDLSGALRVLGGGGGSTGGSVGAAGVNGTTAQSVQGITGGVPQNAYPAQYNSPLPTYASGQSGYISVDPQGRIILAPGSSTLGNTATAASTQTIGPTPVVGTASIVGKASPGNLYGFSVTAGGTAMFLAIINATAVPAAGAAITPWECIPVPVNGYVARRQDIPDRYTVGIVGVITSSCTTFTAVSPQVVSLLLQ